MAAGRGQYKTENMRTGNKMIDTNIKWVNFYMLREVSPLMIARNQGHIINVASLNGWEAYGGGNVALWNKSMPYVQFRAVPGI